ncbi:uncharacterized protein LOC100900874 [Galendromus occidentalis]|uniref:Uncharacterized protein LOC100900874 n=1 Tax=Galendromus occidentalis TaxID=34638 RepID=A0AAJ6VXI8_9ACAR|nr:uncharacterized protein LOC100900874 [Galendromus occidentalis]
MMLNVLSICLALILGAQGAYVNDNQIEMRKIAAQGRLHRAVAQFAATGRGLSGITEVVMRAVERSMEAIPSIPSLDPQECMKRSVCEAHNQPDRYGVVGLALQLIFPPYLTGESEDAPLISKYQQAARYGRRNDAECGRHFDGCIVSPMEVTQKLLNYIMQQMK